MSNTLYTTLKQYILRRLGSPVINIEITDDQLEDIIDEGVKEFVECHTDGVNIGYTQIDLEAGVSTYQLDDNIQAVLDVLTVNNITLDTDDPWLIKSSFYVGNVSYIPDLLDVEVFRQWYSMIEDTFKIPVLYDYNTTTNKLILHTPPKSNQTCFIKVYQSEDDIKKILTNLWIKKYCLELARRQWGTNLMKFTNVNLPGGSQFNFQDILSMAETNIEKLIEELEDKWTEPLDPEVG